MLWLLWGHNWPITRVSASWQSFEEPMIQCDYKWVYVQYTEKYPVIYLSIYIYIFIYIYIRIHIIHINIYMCVCIYIYSCIIYHILHIHMYKMILICDSVIVSTVGSQAFCFHPKWSVHWAVPPGIAEFICCCRGTNGVGTSQAGGIQFMV